LCVGEWSRRHWSSAENIHWRRLALSLVSGQWRLRVGRRLAPSSHSAAEQWTTTTTLPHWQGLSSQAAVANRIRPMLRWTHVTSVRCTLQRHSRAFSLHLIVSSAMSSDPLANSKTHHCSLHWGLHKREHANAAETRTILVCDTTIDCLSLFSRRTVTQWPDLQNILRVIVRLS